MAVLLRNVLQKGIFFLYKKKHSQIAGLDN